MAKCPENTYTINWKPYFLRPNHPREGVEKPPNTPDNPRVGRSMKQAGESVGINFTGACDRAPNTIYAHCLLAYTTKNFGAKLQNDVQERLFKGYFTDGAYPNVENLVALTKDIGAPFDEDEVRRVLTSGELEAEVMREADQLARRQRGQGVPFFYFNGQPAFAGAQDPATFVSVFEQI
jgi:predicted DsbA family dithiol-disulfide isomerase